MFINTQECFNNCSIKNLINNLCILEYNENSNEEIIQAQNIMLKNIEKDFSSLNYNTSNLDNGGEDIIEFIEMKITLTTTINQKRTINRNNNITSINLEECEISLRKAYNISDQELIYIKKIDIVQKGMKIPLIEYDIYAKLNNTNLVKLNLTFCDRDKISLLIPVQISENLDKLNTSSKYFNDICYVATSDIGTDITLKDRKKDFIEKNKTICQNDCDFLEYDYENKKAKCSCKAQEAKTSILDMKINKTKLYHNFIDIKNIANINLLVCYRVLFSKKGIKNNIACFLIIPVIIFHIICIFIFYKKKKKNIDKIIKNIIFGIEYWDLILADERENKGKNKKTFEDMKKKKKKKIKKKTDTKNITSTKNKNKETNKNIKKKHQNPQRKKRDKKKYKDKNLTQNLNREHINNFSDSNNNSKEINLDKKKKLKIKKAKKIMAFNDEELNNLEYNLALNYDKRTYCEYYKSLLLTKHIFIFSFIYNKDYNSKIIKIDLFFINFIISYTVNALFFSDNTMHKIYKDEGSFNFIYPLPQIIYSTLISSILNIILHLFSLTEGNILSFKNNKEKRNLTKRKNKLQKKLNIKFALYFIISFIFLVLFIYVFCCV